MEKWQSRGPWLQKRREKSEEKVRGVLECFSIYERDIRDLFEEIRELSIKRKGLESNEETKRKILLVMREVGDREDEVLETIQDIKEGAWRNALKCGFGTDFDCWQVPDSEEDLMIPMDDSGGQAGEDHWNPVDGFRPDSLCPDDSGGQAGEDLMKPVDGFR